MINSLLGSKNRMGQIFIQGTRVPVTWVKVGPCVVTHIKNEKIDGYWAVQLGFSTKRTIKLTKAEKGHLKGAIKNNKRAPKFLREVRFEKEPEFKVGDIVKLSDLFKKGDVITVTGTSKGKGFAGVMKRWGFAGGPRTHGQSDRPRSPGSIGQGTSPGRVHKGKKMAGRMGNDRVTVKNLIIADIDEDQGMIAISGSVPGVPDSLLFIKRIKSGKLEELVEEVPEVEMQVEEEAEDKEDKSIEKPTQDTPTEKEKVENKK